MYRCEICGREVSGYGIKILNDNHIICRKGICRNIYDKWHDIINSKAEFNHMLRTGEIKEVYREGYGGKQYKKVNLKED